MSAFNPPSFGDEIDQLLAPARLSPLGPGEPNVAVREQLQALSIDRLFGRQAVDREQPVDRKMASACLAGLWLYHGFLEESHTISQQIETREGSYWHGLMHRREPDYANAKYWFRRVGEHPIGDELASAARELAGTGELDAASKFLAGQTRWDHFRFVDLCEAAANGHSASGPLCRRIQEREWWLLFGYCYDRACSRNHKG
ncbi:MAG TPA: hypothetical protein VFI31_14105 [Pirellulales bacterium]|nr:hypothetical protein [Pirellulales bacterium]